jgi:predicted dehydrogenase
MISFFQTARALSRVFTWTGHTTEEIPMSSPRVGVIGYGLAGRVFHAPLIEAEEGLELAVIVTADAERAAAAAAKYPSVAVLDSPDAMLATGVDVVVIAAPTPRHVEIAERTIGGGIATVVDKPLAVRAADALRLVEQAEQRNVLLTVFQNRRWDGDFLSVRRLVEDGALGEVWRFESRFEWISSRARPEWKVATAGREGGGVAYDLGVHLLDQAIALFGPVGDVYGELNVRRSGGVNDDDAFIAITHTNGIRSHLAMASLVAQRGFRFRVLGSAGAYTKWGLDPQEKQLGAGVVPTDAEYGREPAESWGLIGRDGDTRPVPTGQGAYPEFYRRLALALDGRGEVPVRPRDAIEPIRIIEELHVGR